MHENKSDIINTPIIKPIGDFYFKILAKAIPHLLVIADPDTYRIQFINKLLPNRTHDSMMGKELFDFVWPEFTELITQKIQEVKNTNEPEKLDIMVFSERNIERKAWYRLNISIIQHPENLSNSLMLLAEDITEAKHTEVEIINKSERIKAIINNTNDIICSIDRDYNLLEFNSMFANMIKKGYGFDLTSGMPIFQFVDPAKHEHLKAIYKRVLNGETYCDIESFSTLNNNLVFNETNYNPIYNADKEISGINIFSKDITERVINEKKMKSDLKEKEVLLSEIHHRIKNNLAMVSSLLQLQEMNSDKVEVKEALALSRKRIKSTALIHELLYRNESFQYINLKGYLTELFQHFKINENIQLFLKGDEVTLNLSTAMPLGLMLNEILLNSFKHSYKDDSKGHINISATLLSNQLTINYRDFEGSFPETIDFRNPNTTGLGLIHTFTEQLNGSIELVRKTPPEYKIQIPINEN